MLFLKNLVKARLCHSSWAEVGTRATGATASSCHCMANRTPGRKFRLTPWWGVNPETIAPCFKEVENPVLTAIQQSFLKCIAICNAARPFSCPLNSVAEAKLCSYRAELIISLPTLFFLHFCHSVRCPGGHLAGRHLSPTHHCVSLSVMVQLDFSPLWKTILFSVYSSSLLPQAPWSHKMRVFLRWEDLLFACLKTLEWLHHWLQNEGRSSSCDVHACSVPASTLPLIPSHFAGFNFPSPPFRIHLWSQVGVYYPCLSSMAPLVSLANDL